MTNVNVIIGLLLAIMIFITGFMEKNTDYCITPNGKIVMLNKVDTMNEITNNMNGPYTHVNDDDSIHNIMNHPAFEGFGQFILPITNSRLDAGMQLKNVSTLLPYHNHVDIDTTVGIINHIIDEVNDGITIFYDLYTEHQKHEDPFKESTGLFFFRGAPGAPFAIVCPGGGFAYVGSIHEGFPHAIQFWESHMSE